jgi:hypothetical protein
MVVLGVSVLGCVFTAIGLTLYRRNQHLQRYGLRAEGTVTQLIRGVTRNSDGFGQNVNYTPEFRFQDEAGLTHTVRSRSGSNPSPFKVGQQVKVLYEPSKPSTAEIDSFGQMFLVPVIFMILGPGLIIGAAIFLWIQRP